MTRQPSSTEVLGGTLALDLSGLVGWAYGVAEHMRPSSFGSWQLPKAGGEGHRYASFQHALEMKIEETKPSHLILEAALSFQALLGVSTARVVQQQYALRAFAYAEAWHASCSISEVSADIVRMALLGQCRFAKGVVKTEVVRYCLERGWKVHDDNEADAIMTWLWHAKQVSGGGRPLPGPLWRTLGTA